MQKTGTYSSIDGLRAVICLQIVGFHCYYSALEPVFRSSLGETASWAMAHLRFGYESFFVLAGYFLAQSFRPGNWTYFSVPIFLLKRLVRLAVPYWLAIGFGIIGFELSSLLSGHDYESPNWSTLLPLLFFVQDLVPVQLPSVTYWFMAPLMQFTLLWSIVFWLIRKWFLSRSVEYHNQAVRGLTVIVSGAFLGSLICVVQHVESRWSLAHNAVYLCLGCLAFWHYWGVYRGVFVVAMLSLLAVGYIDGNMKFYSASLTAVVIQAAQYRPHLPGGWPVRCLVLVGGWSYSIYLTHTYLIYRVINVWMRLDEDRRFGWALLTWCSAVLGSIVLGCAFYWVVERPLAGLSHRLSYRSRRDNPIGPAAVNVA